MNASAELLRRPHASRLGGWRDVVHVERRVRTGDLRVRPRRVLVLDHGIRARAEPVVECLPGGRRERLRRERREIRRRIFVRFLRPRLRCERAGDGAVQRREHRRERRPELSFPLLRRDVVGVVAFRTLVQKVDQVRCLLRVLGEIFTRGFNRGVRRALRLHTRALELTLHRVQPRGRLLVRDRRRAQRRLHSRVFLAQRGER